MENYANPPLDEWTVDVYETGCIRFVRINYGDDIHRSVIEGNTSYVRNPRMPDKSLTELFDFLREEADSINGDQSVLE